MQRPDIVLLMTDQQRHDWVGYAGDGFAETPALDDLAARGVRFDNAYSASTTCVPSRSSLLTGIHHHRLPQSSNRALPDGSWSVARELRAAGYQTALVGRMHLHPICSDVGFETTRTCESLSPGSGYEPSEGDDYRRWLEVEGRPDWRLVHPGPEGEVHAYLPGLPHTFPDDAGHHSTSWIEREALGVLRERDPARPLFLVVSFPHPHAPYDPPEPYASRYAPADLALPRDGVEVNDVLVGEFREAFERTATKTCRTDADRELLRRVLTAIRGLIAHIDDAVASIVAELDWASTLLWFTSDHGDYGGHRGTFSKVPWIPFDDLFRVPLVVSGGALGAEPRVSATPVQAPSFAATCLDYAGVEVDGDALDFPSLRPALVSEGADVGPVVGCISQGYPTVRCGDLKLITCRGTGDRMLFDLAEDPGETRSLVDEPARSVDLERLQAVLDEACARRPLEGPVRAGDLFGTMPQPSAARGAPLGSAGMVSEEIAVEVDAPPAELWSFLLDLTNEPRWRSGVAEVALVEGVAGEPGSRYEERCQEEGLGVPIVLDLTLIDVEPPERLAIEVQIAVTAVRLTYHLAPGASGGTSLRALIEVDAPGPVARVTAKATIASFRDDMAALVALADAGPLPTSP